MRPEKISVAMVTNDMNINGISTVVMNYCKYLNKDKFNVTIIAGKPINELYVEECKNMALHSWKCLSVEKSRSCFI